MSCLSSRSSSVVLSLFVVFLLSSMVVYVGAYAVLDQTVVVPAGDWSELHGYFSAHTKYMMGFNSSGGGANGNGIDLWVMNETSFQIWNGSDGHLWGESILLRNTSGWGTKMYDVALWFPESGTYYFVFNNTDSAYPRTVHVWITVPEEGLDPSLILVVSGAITIACFAVIYTHSRGEKAKKTTRMAPFMAVATVAWGIGWCLSFFVALETAQIRSAYDIITALNIITIGLGWASVGLFAYMTFAIAKGEKRKSRRDRRDGSRPVHHGG